MQPVILITGTSGFSGGYIYNYLRKQGYQCLSHYGRAIGDIASPHTYQSWITDFNKQPNIIIHTADQSPDIGVTNEHIDKNVLSANNIVQYAKKVGVKKIIYFSSDSVYGQDPNREHLELDSPIVNPSYYGKMKLICEEQFASSGIPTAILRLPLVVGKGAKRHWLARLIKKIKNAESVTIYNPNRMFNNVVHIQYLSELISKLIDVAKFPIEDYTLLPASIRPMPIHEVVNKFVQGTVRIETSQENIPGGPIVLVNPLVYGMPRFWDTTQTLDEYVIDEGLNKT